MEWPGGFGVVKSPESGLWRVAYRVDPLGFSVPLDADRLLSSRGPNRFDSPVGDFSVLYAGTTQEGCFVETIARFRKDTHLPPEIEEEFDKHGWMAIGSVPTSWRDERRKVQFSVEEDSLFVDVDSARTLTALRQHFSELWEHLGIGDLDRGVILGDNRLVTRWISWAVHSMAYEDGTNVFSGIRYSSRLDGEYENWAIYEGTPMKSLQEISVQVDDAALVAAAAAMGVIVR